MTNILLGEYIASAHFKEMRLMLIQVAARIVGRDNAQDVVSEIVLKMLEQHGNKSFPGIADVSRFLYRATKNKALDHIRKSKRIILCTDFYEYMSEMGNTELQNERSRTMRELVNTLPPRERAILRLKYKHGMSFEDIANATGDSENAVKQRAFRQRKRLRSMLDKAA